MVIGECKYDDRDGDGDNDEKKGAMHARDS